MKSFAQNQKVRQLIENSFLYDTNTGFLEELYHEFSESPEKLSPSWKKFFQSIPDEIHSVQAEHEQVVSFLRDYFLKKQHGSYLKPGKQPIDIDPGKQTGVMQLIEAFRQYGHTLADIDPLGTYPSGIYKREKRSELFPANYNLDESDLEKKFPYENSHGTELVTLREILNHLTNTYCRKVGIEFFHVNTRKEKIWLQRRFENDYSNFAVKESRSREIFSRLVAAETFEKYLNTKFTGQKRFSLEGADSLIPLLAEIVRQSGASPVKKLVIGMSHRGRLNVLVNIIGKPLTTLFREFEGKSYTDSMQDSGDVKYHLGYTSNVDTFSGEVHISLAANPSHLESIDPVVLGAARSRQRRFKDKTGEMVLPVLIHGDAAFAAQGIVFESFQLSQSEGYSVGGTIHIIINNQIGFTRNNPLGPPHCTEVAKVTGVPVLHVNADDPEAVLFTTQLAFDYRMKFKKDIIIDLVSYRRYGHNEIDEPRVTQPLMYKIIENHPTVVEIYAERLIKSGVFSKDEPEEYISLYRNRLQNEERVAPHLLLNQPSRLAAKWHPYRNKNKITFINTAYPLDKLIELAKGICYFPAEFELHRTVKKIIDKRTDMANGKIPLDWGFAELLSWASLLEQGYDVRMSGQDSRCGTFFHRHSVLFNQKDGASWNPIQNLPQINGSFTTIDTILSEAAVLGFEYGYSLGSPDTLVIWEAQFGDFANAAQVIIDQFITSGETKWDRFCGLVLFLPHGYDGQGPEHSSARIERFLNMSAQENIQICVPTLPAQIFHLMRRQMLQPFRKPLIVMTPKNLLRHNEAVSSLEDLANGYFNPVIDEIDNKDSSRGTLLLCAGKIYFELLQARNERKIQGLPIIRLEQIYPFPLKELSDIIHKYDNVKTIKWVQEEPENQGAWGFVQKHISSLMNPNQALTVVARAESASPAVGFHVLHKKQQNLIIDRALG
jgi:2-oxoglutarate dehydrogenase E1 component